MGTRRGSGFNWSANKNAPGFNGPGEFELNYLQFQMCLLVL